MHLGVCLRNNPKLKKLFFNWLIERHKNKEINFKILMLGLISGKKFSFKKPKTEEDKYNR